MRWCFVSIGGSVGLALLLTAFAATLYRIFPNSQPVVQYAFVPGALVTWSIWGDNFPSEAAFKGCAVSVSYFVNAFIGSLIGVAVALFRFGPRNFTLRTVFVTITLVALLLGVLPFIASVVLEWLL